MTRGSSRSYPRGVEVEVLSGPRLEVLLEVREKLSREITQRTGPRAAPLSEAALACTLGACPGAVMICTLEGRFIEVSEVFLRETGYARDEVLGRTGREIGLWTEPNHELEELQRALRVEGEIRIRELAYRTRQGQARRMLVAAEVLPLQGR